MILVPMGLLFAAYQLVWYGYATLKQPQPGNCKTCATGCCGFLDLLLPSHVAAVNKCIQDGWIGSAGGTGYPAVIGKTLPATGGQTINVPGRGLENPAPSPGWAGSKL